MRILILGTALLLAAAGCSPEPAPAPVHTRRVAPRRPSAEPPVPDGGRKPNDFRYRITPPERYPEDAMRNPDVPPVRIGGAEPEYREVARKAGIRGIVILEIVVDKKGRVIAGRVLKPLPFGLDQSAMEAVRTWRYKPGSHRGQTVATLLNVRVTFPPSTEPVNV